MRLSRPFIQLPWRYDTTAIAAEIADLDAAAWMTHPSRMQGNSAVALVSRGGHDNDDFDGSMAVTPHLEACPALHRLLASFGEVIGRSRLMKLAAGAEVASHVDFNYHWFSRIRIHVPIVTTDAVTFFCGNERVQMATGESWIFDSWRRHRVTNEGTEDRIHLVIDTSGSARFWDTVRTMEKVPPHQWASHVEDVDVGDADTSSLRVEKYNIAPVMAPGEMSALAEDLIADFEQHAANPPQKVDQYRRLLRDLCADWRNTFAQFGFEPEGLPHYRSLLQQAQERMDADRRALVTGSNQIGVNPIIVQRILRAALGPGAKG